MCGPPHHHLPPHHHQPPAKRVKTPRNKEQAKPCEIREEDLHGTKLYTAVPTNVLGPVTSTLERILEREAGKVEAEAYSKDWCSKYQKRLGVTVSAFKGDFPDGFFMIFDTLEQGEIQGGRLASMTSGQVRACFEGCYPLLKEKKWKPFVDAFM
jgi:hypothetical protein